MLVKLVRTEKSAKNIKTFWFAPEKSLDYTAGQFVEFYLPHKKPDVRGQKRWFTLSSSPSEKLISITTKQAVDRISSFKQTLFGLKNGDLVSVSEPMGDFVLPKDAQIPIVFVAGGIGITPMRSMVQWLTDIREKRNIVLIYATKTLNKFAFRKLFEKYGIRPIYVLPANIASKSEHAGPVTGQFIQNLSHHVHSQLIYISGPEQFTEKLEKELLDAGTPKENLVLDFFPGYQID